MTAVLFASTQLSKSFPGGVNEAAASEGCCAEGESDAWIWKKEKEKKGSF
jgi:hypothetical protein